MSTSTEGLSEIRMMPPEKMEITPCHNASLSSVSRCLSFWPTFALRRVKATERMPRVGLRN